MSRLLGGSLGLIVLSALSILLGWVNSEQLLIYVSILCSAGVAVCLALAYNRSRNDSGSGGVPPAGRRRPPE